MKVPVIQWVVTILVIVLPLAFGSRLIYRWFRPGERKRPSGVLTAIVAFLLVWVVVILFVLAWEVLKAAARPSAQTPGKSVNLLASDSRLQRTPLRSPLSRKALGGQAE